MDWTTASIITLATAVACEVGLWFLRQSGESISLIWPAAGIAAALFHRWGHRAFPWIALGHLWIWVRLGLTPVTTAVPLLYTGEAWLAWHLAFGLARLRLPDRNSINHQVWQMLVVPWLAAIPCALLIGALATWYGRFPMEEFAMSTGRIAIAHVHGFVAFAPALAHMFTRDFQLLSPDDHWIGFAALAAGFGLMLLAFTGFFRVAMGMSSAAYLPFPLLIVAGVSLRPPVIATALVLWCVTTTAITGTGMGPFARTGHLNPLELGIYNLVICYTTYLTSAGTTRLLHQLRRNELTLEAAGVEVWEWDSRRGFHSIKGDRKSSRVHAHVGNLGATKGLAHLSGHHTEAADGVPESWKQRLEEKRGPGELLLSAGRVVSRNRDGSAQEAIGMIQDLSALRKAEDALIALGHQRALLKSLQTRLNPHFLFNALNAVRALVYIDPAQASDAVTTLARLLRANLRNIERPQIPLADEMQLVKDLLAVSALRFGDRLQTDVSIPAATECALVPPMAIFNLVENALVHGIEKSPGTGTIAIHASTSDRVLEVTIRSPGKLSTTLSPGIGMKDLLQRLELLYGTDARFELTQHHNNIVQARMTLPFLDYESVDR